MAAPWRKVVAAERIGRNNVRQMTVINRLECGHVQTFRGDKALDARYAEKRRCKDCDPE